MQCPLLTYIEKTAEHSRDFTVVRASLIRLTLNELPGLDAGRRKL